MLIFAKMLLKCHILGEKLVSPYYWLRGGLAKHRGRDQSPNLGFRLGMYRAWARILRPIFELFRPDLNIFGPGPEFNSFNLFPFIVVSIARTQTGQPN